MSNAYDWHPLPNKVNVVCPDCSGNAIFEFAVYFEIALKKDVEYFKKSKFFDYELSKNYSGQKCHIAIFYPGLYLAENIKDMPDGYSIEKLQHGKYLSHSQNLDYGSKVCTSCVARRRAKLSWPEDAFYKCEIKGNVLWAYNRESLIDLRDFIKSDSRKIKNHSYRSFLLHIPKIFLDSKNRERVVAKLNKIIK